MQLTHLSLTNFRNFARLDIEVPRGAVLLVGGNAQGKTSLLEAVYFLATFDSFHASSDRQLINFLAAREAIGVARITADFCREGNVKGSNTRRLEVRIIQESGSNGPRLRKEVLLDGVKRKVGEASGAFNAVLFLPHMLRVVEGAPEERRRYLNQAMSQTIASYATLLDTYQHLLTQRNALLKQIAERGSDPGSAAAQLAYWDEQLSATGAQIIHARIQAIAEIERLAARAHRELTRGAEVLRLAYQPSFDPLPQRTRQYALPLETPPPRSGDFSSLSVEKIQQGFRRCLEDAHSEELARGVTTLGPHRDELRFLSNGMDLGIYGSRGQVRTAVLATKLAEVSWMKERTGHWPVLLLDEVLAELDGDRRTDLIQRLLESEQVLLTTTDLDLFSPDFTRQATIWNIQAGRLLV